MPPAIHFDPPSCPLVLQRNSRVELLLTLQVVDEDTLEPTGDVADLTDVTSVRAVLRRGRDSKLPADVTFTATVVSPANAGTVRVKATKTQMLRVPPGEGYVFGVQTDMASDGPFDGLGWVVGDVTVVDNLFGAP
jgi:hypothetical protein